MERERARERERKEEREGARGNKRERESGWEMKDGHEMGHKTKRNPMRRKKMGMRADLQKKKKRKEKKVRLKCWRLEMGKKANDGQVISVAHDSPPDSH